MSDPNTYATTTPEPASIETTPTPQVAVTPMTVADHDVAVPVGTQPAEQPPVHDVAPDVPPPVPPAAPTVVDAPYAAQEGSTLTCTMGNWIGEPTSYAYEWWADGAVVGTGTPYPLAVSDVGRAFACHLTATNAGGSTSVDSNIVVAA
jgi:hypothetical protein